MTAADPVSNEAATKPSRDRGSGPLTSRVRRQGIPVHPAGSGWHRF